MYILLYYECRYYKLDQLLRQCYQVSGSAVMRFVIAVKQGVVVICFRVLEYTQVQIQCSVFTCTFQVCVVVSRAMGWSIRNMTFKTASVTETVHTHKCVYFSIDIAILLQHSSSCPFQTHVASKAEATFCPTVRVLHIQTSYILEAPPTAM